MQNTDNEPDEDFAQALLVMERNLKYVEQLGLDQDTVRAYRKILIYLKGRRTEEVRDILGVTKGRKHSKRSAEENSASLGDVQIAAFTGEELRSRLADPKIPRGLLERLASVRFGVTRGALSALRTNDALRDKLLTLLENEGTHDAIARAAVSRADPNSSP